MKINVEQLKTLVEAGDVSAIETHILNEALEKSDIYSALEKGDVVAALSGFGIAFACTFRGFWDGSD